MSLLIPPPTKFVGLRGHTGFSVFDGLGYPSDHIDFVLENGMDAWGLTDHGNGSGLAHAHKHATKIQKSGRQSRKKAKAVILLKTKKKQRPLTWVKTNGNDVITWLSLRKMLKVYAISSH